MADKPSISFDALPLGDLMLWLQDNMLPDANTFLLQGSVGPNMLSPITNDTAGWTVPTFENSWTDFGSGFQTTAYFQDPLGFVHLTGAMKGGATNTTAFTLPAGMRPGETRTFPAAGASGAAAGCTVGADGSVNPIGTGVGTFVAIDGIIFLPSQ